MKKLTKTILIVLGIISIFVAGIVLGRYSTQRHVHKSPHSAIQPPVIIHPGEVGVVLEQGEVQDHVLYEGVHSDIPKKQTVIKIDVRLQKFQGKIVALSSDNKHIEYKVLLNYRILPDKAHLVYKEQLAFNSLIKSLVEDVIKTVTVQYKEDEVYANRSKFKDSVSKDLKLMLGKYHLSLVGFAIEDMAPHSPITTSP